MGKWACWLWVLFVFGLVFGQASTAVNPSEENFIIVIDTLSLLLLLITTFFAWELYKLMRGGQLAKSWGYITVGIFAFSFGKLAQVGVAAQLWETPKWFPNIISLVVAIMLVLGVFSQRKMLG